MLPGARLRPATTTDSRRLWELAPGARPEALTDTGFAWTVAESIRAALCRLNSEFAHYVPAEQQTPAVELRPSGDPEYFPPGVKHRYTRP